MIKKALFLFFIGCCCVANAQRLSKDFRVQDFSNTNDTIFVDTVSILPSRFKVLDAFNKVVPVTKYQIDFTKAILIIDARIYPEITVEYMRYPDFLTKVYAPFDKKMIVPNRNNTDNLYSLTTNKKVSEIELFSGLETKGFISRGLTSGNNQNAVTNAALDLEISGKLSKDVTLRANIFDTNIPLQQNGYSQNITDFDRIFIELYSDTWRVKAGDVSLDNTDTYFMPFTKQVSGLEVEASVGKNLTVAASGAIVRGKFSTFYFTGTEGNQGPYKIFGANNEAAIVIIEGTVTVYVNGTPIRQGENGDYMVDHNLAEIRFNTTFPITNDMRIAIDFQYSDRNYTRYITYETATYKTSAFQLSGYFYNENDAKTQPLQQNLSETQLQVLTEAGNDVSKMISENAFIDTYSENKILYRKVEANGQVFFEFADEESETLYNVSFSNVGQNQGNYVLDRNSTSGTIFRFVGINLGDYNPISQLFAPTKFQTAAIKSKFQPSPKTNIQTEIALSNNDQNLFSSLDDENNIGIAALLGWKQTIIDKKWALKSTVNFEFKQADFFTEQQGFESVEFNRDWNLVDNTGDKSLLFSKLVLENKQSGFISYALHHLQYASNFKGVKHFLNAKINQRNVTFFANASYLKNSSAIENGSFLIAKAAAEFDFSKKWIGSFVNIETNDKKNVITNQKINSSHQFQEYETYVGVGDSVKVFAKLGFNYRTNDSIRAQRFTQINNRKTVYLNTKLVQNKNTNIGLYANYRITENSFKENEQALNAKLNYNQRFFKGFFNLATNYETASGNVANQEYVYVKTEPGLGFYTWIDYNNNDIEEFNEFEIAQFQDQASYLRVPLPNLNYITTQRVRWKQRFTINPSIWKTKKGVKKFLSHFYNQLVLSMDNEQPKEGAAFNLSPFNIRDKNLISAQVSLQNQLYFNRNLQQNSVIYSVGSSQNKQQYFIGNQENLVRFNQLEYAHKFGKFWLLELQMKYFNNDLNTENFENRNYQIVGKNIYPKLSYEYNKNHRLSFFYQLNNKKNTTSNFEKLAQQQLGFNYFYATKKDQQINTSVTAFLNDFVGDQNTPVAYQMLEGLQSGQNYTWSMVFQQKINSFLNLNISYLGRKSETSKAIHTGNVQIRADF